jgi:hypothetical protein
MDRRNRTLLDLALRNVRLPDNLLFSDVEAALNRAYAEPDRDQPPTVADLVRRLRARTSLGSRDAKALVRDFVRRRDAEAP